MTGIVQLVSGCIEKLHLANLVDAYAELIRSRAYWNEVNAFGLYAFLGILGIGLLFGIYVAVKTNSLAN